MTLKLSDDGRALLTRHSPSCISVSYILIHKHFFIFFICRTNNSSYIFIYIYKVWEKKDISSEKYCRVELYNKNKNNFTRIPGKILVEFRPPQGDRLY